MYAPITRLPLRATALLATSVPAARSADHQDARSRLVVTEAVTKSDQAG